MIIERIKNLYLFVLKFKILILISLLVFLLINILNFDKFKLDASSDTLILENDKDYKLYKKYSKIFPSEEFLILAYKSPYGNINKKYIEDINQLKNLLKNIKGIDYIFTINDAPLILSQNISLSELNIENIKNINSKDIKIKDAVEELRNNPIFLDQIINSKSTISALIIYLKQDIELNEIIEIKENLNDKFLKKKNNSKLKNELKEITKKYEIRKNTHNKNRHLLITDIRSAIKSLNKDEYLYLGGISMIADDSIEFVKKDIKNFGVGVFLFIVLILSLLFRKIKWVIIPLITTFYSVASIIGLLSILGWKITVISSNFISLIIILTISMNIHIIVRYQIIYKKEKTSIYNISETMKEMFLPCVYTSLTTIVAFFSLVFSDIRPVIDFGWIMIFGLIITFLSSFIVLPTLISFFPLTKNYQNHNNNIINILFKLIKKYGKSIIFINILLFIIAIWGTTQLKVENSFINYFKEKTEIYKGMKLIDEELGGTTPLDIIIKFKDSVINENTNSTDSDIIDLNDLFEEEKNSIETWLTTDKLETIKEITIYLNHKEEIGKIQSIQSFIKFAEQINKGPLTNFELSIIYKSIPEDLKESLLSPYLSIENNLIRINTRILDSKNIKRNELIESIKKDLNNKFDNVEFIETNGLLVLYNNMLQSLFTSQIKSMAFVMISIFIMFLILFRSLKLSIAAIIPNIFAALFILGLIGLFKIPLDMMTITIAAITIGIAVDNSIHYIYRIKKEMNIKNDLLKSIKNCHMTVGNAILTTSFTIAFGFSILLLSNFLPTIYFGIFTSIAMIVAMLGVMITLPKLLILFKIKNL